MHKIRIHTQTFGYADPTRNIPFQTSYFERHIIRNPHKAENRRLGYENSEDALSWNVFAALAGLGDLGALATALSCVAGDDEPELFLWGLPVRLSYPDSPTTAPILDQARKHFEPGIHKMKTEPDIMLLMPGRCLILIEAKFTSGNTVVKDGEPDVDGEKPRSREGLLRRYSASELPAGILATEAPATPFFSQLYRNLVFAIWMADRLSIDWRVVSLTSELHAANEPDPAPFMHAMLAPEHRQKFVRYRWEQLYRDHVEHRADRLDLADYLRFKSANGIQGLAIA